MGTQVATFLPAERVVEFVSEILEWYREKAEGSGRVRLGQIILTQGIRSLLDHLRVKFPDHVNKKALSPQTIRTR